MLGGGLTGLATAFYLTLALPRARITLYEASNRLGGWIDTEKANLTTPDGDAVTVHFERAARMVKPTVNASLPKWDDLVFFELVRIGPVFVAIRWIGGGPGARCRLFADCRRN